jgi:hypothetical protein
MKTGYALQPLSTDCSKAGSIIILSSVTGLIQRPLLTESSYFLYILFISKSSLAFNYKIDNYLKH